MNVQVQMTPPLEFTRHLIDLVGAEHVLLGDAIVPFATDVYRSRSMPLAVVRPGAVDQLQAVVRACSGAKVALFVRGGGASYTDGYLPSRPDSILIDMGRLDRIVEINERDGYVTVEAGVTWRMLKEALDPSGLRTPFFGPFSGFAATVAGSLSQHSISHGSGAHGMSAQSLISLDVVVASGALLRTGSAARGAAPFSRWYGPDLAGLFCGDCGVLGVKARITLPLIRRKAAFECLSFAYQTLPALAAARRRARGPGRRTFRHRRGDLRGPDRAPAAHVAAWARRGRLALRAVTLGSIETTAADCTRRLGHAARGAVHGAFRG
jgi:D-lactate dehydrogenase (cytochrome)